MTQDPNRPEATSINQAELQPLLRRFAEALSTVNAGLAAFKAKASAPDAKASGASVARSNSASRSTD
ncbi:MAG TPA: hypothetical protein VGG27_14545 [Magnetospirillaceae bacterium]|jgi:hypothetical protein